MTDTFILLQIILAVYCIVGEIIEPESMYFENTEYNIEVGKALIPSPKFAPANAYALDYSVISSNVNIAKVLDSGLIVGVTEGSVVITVKAENGISVNFVVNVEMEKQEHSYSAATTPATCTENGAIVYTCACGDTYTKTIPATGHTFDGSVCTACDYDKADDCSCRCHNDSFFARFIWNIINFFNKIFRKNETCDCGAEHY